MIKSINRSIAAKKRWQNEDYRNNYLRQMKEVWQRTKIRMKGNQINKGRKMSEANRKRLSKLLIGNKRSVGKIPWNYIDGRSKNCSPARYGDDWEAIRYLVYLRDKFTCQYCGIKGVSLHIHHKIPFLQSLDNSLKNLITLCPSCHRKEDARIIKEIKLEVL